jgi:hypothetical protein
MRFMYLHGRLLLTSLAFEIAEVEGGRSRPGSEYHNAFMRTYTAAVEMIRWILDDDHASPLLQNL